MSENQSILVKLLKSIFNLFGSSSDSSSQSSNQKTGNISQFSHCFNSFSELALDVIIEDIDEGAMKYFYVEMNPILRKLNEGVYLFTKPKDEILALLKAHPSYQSGLLSDNHESFYKD